MVKKPELLQKFKNTLYENEGPFRGLNYALKIAVGRLDLKKITWRETSLAIHSSGFDITTPEGHFQIQDI